MPSRHSKSKASACSNRMPSTVLSKAPKRGRSRQADLGHLMSCQFGQAGDAALCGSRSILWRDREDPFLGAPLTIARSRERRGGSRARSRPGVTRSDAQQREHGEDQPLDAPEHPAGLEGGRGKVIALLWPRATRVLAEVTLWQPGCSTRPDICRAPETERRLRAAPGKPQRRPNGIHRRGPLH